VTVGIFNLRERPQYMAAVAERIWKAFWQHRGTPLAQISDGLDALLKAERAIPFGLVAEIDGRPRGNALVIDNDAPAKPDLAPWLAALWVDEDARGRGIAGALLEAAARRCADLGVPRLYLNSRPALQDFYTAQGWRILERGVGAHGVTVYDRQLDRLPALPLP
jgi:GNAT superfamily N-acetyltransferase